MIEFQSNGNLCFRRAREPIFLFEKNNYDKHCAKHERLKDKSYLQEVEITLFNPDVITGHTKKIRIRYRVLKSENKKYNNWVNVIKIPYVLTKKGRVNYIKSCFDIWAYDWQVIHPKEIRVWQKPNTLI